MKVNVEYRNTLYYGKYQYKVCMDVESNFRRSHCDGYDDYLQYVADTDGQWFYGNSARRPPLVSDIPAREEVARYYRWSDSVDKSVHNYGTRQEGKRLSLYSNDPTFLKDAAAAIDPVKGVKGYYHAKVPTEPDILIFKSPPKYAYRKYFKAAHAKSQFRDSLLEFIKTQQEMGTRIALSRSLDKHLNRASSFGGWYVSDSACIDYDDESMEMALMLMFGENMKPRTYRLLQRTDTV